MKRLKRTLLPYAYHVLRAWWFVRRPHTAGVKCLIEHNSDFLLIRHTYGAQSWTLPGGGVKRGESPEAAVVREVQEELGITIGVPAYLGTFEQRVEYKYDVVHCFHTTVVGREFALDEVEVAAGEWFPVATLPADLSPSAARALGLLWVKE